jgi:hypothetical protein
LTSCKENTKKKSEIKTTQSPYTLPVPKGWTTELFMIPISFAPSIPYKGIEDIRFAPGWGNAQSNEYWAYAFLWSLEGTPEINAEIIQRNLSAYYAGLIASNIESRKILAEKIFPPKVAIEKIKTDAEDIETFSGSIYMLDYMQQKPITLYCIVHLKSCTAKNRTFLLHEISSKPLTDSIWQSLHQINKDFICNQN